jgi:uncharacterized protein (DUF433 family)
VGHLRPRHDHETSSQAILTYIFGTVKTMQFPELIEARADVMMGKSCLKGTRIPVYLILEKLAAGETTELILSAHPQLRPEHIKAALAYAARLAADEIVIANQ